LPSIRKDPLSSTKNDTRVDTKSADFEKRSRQMVDRLTEIKNEEERIRQCGGAKAIEAQHKKGRLTARERIAKLIDPKTEFFELGLYAAYEMYEEWGGAPAAGTITGLARDDHRERRNGESGRVFPDDGEEGNSRAEYRH
jgi:3-methylcrotonyl-CoA carboxylase beta subunit